MKNKRRVLGGGVGHWLVWAGEWWNTLVDIVNRGLSWNSNKCNGLDRVGEVTRSQPMEMGGGEPQTVPTTVAGANRGKFEASLKMLRRLYVHSSCGLEASLRFPQTASEVALPLSFPSRPHWQLKGQSHSVKMNGEPAASRSFRSQYALSVLALSANFSIT